MFAFVWCSYSTGRELPSYANLDVLSEKYGIHKENYALLNVSTNVSNITQHNENNSEPQAITSAHLPTPERFIHGRVQHFDNLNLSSHKFSAKSFSDISRNISQVIDNLLHKYDSSQRPGRSGEIKINL